MLIYSWHQCKRVPCWSTNPQGNIIANPGFVEQFATTTNAKGERILSAPVLSAIGTIQSVGQIIGMTTLPL